MDADDPNRSEKMPQWRERHPTSNSCAIADKLISTIKGHYDSIQVNFSYYSIISN